MPFFSSEGYRLHYREAGTGPLLLLLHGNSASSVSHQDDLRYFGQRFHAVAIDFLGTGVSDRLAEWPEDWWARGARDAAALVAFLGYTSARVVGTSGGAYAALLMALQSPDVVHSVIADSCAAYATPDERRGEVAFRSRRSPRQIEYWRSAHGEDWEDVIAADSKLLLRTAETGGEPFGGRLSSVRCPVLLTGSLLDRSIPTLDSQMCHMARQLPDSRLFLAKSGAHPLMWTSPHLFRQVADTFLDAMTSPTVHG